MPRVKRGVTKGHRHKKMVAAAKGHRTVRHRLYRRAHESVIHALRYNYAHRKERKADFRKLWIARINAAVRQEGMSYSEFIDRLRKSGVELNRKMLADMAVHDSEGFRELVARLREEPARVAPTT